MFKIFLLSLFLTGCSSIPQPHWNTQWSATAGQTADVITTVVGVGAGLAEEGNPLISAAPLLLLAKPLMPYISAQMYKDDFYKCRNSLYWSSQIGWSASVWNLGVILANPVVGAVVGLGQGVVMHTHRLNSASLYCFTHTK